MLPPIGAYAYIKEAKKVKLQRSLISIGPNEIQGLKFIKIQRKPQNLSFLRNFNVYVCL